MGPLVSGSPCMPPHAACLLSSLQINSFRPLLLKSACAFILRVDPRNLNTSNSCKCHLCISVASSYEGKHMTFILLSQAYFT
jgi:hypothetical protein